MGTLTVPESSRRHYYVVGGTPDDTFNVTFPFFDDEDIEVYVGGVLKTITTHYTLASKVAGDDGGFQSCDVVLNSAVSNTTVEIVGNTPNKRITDFPLTGNFPIDQLNLDIDKLHMIFQQVESILDSRALLVPEPGRSEGYTLPAADAGKLIRWNALATGFENINLTDISAMTMLSENDAGTILSLTTALTNPVIQMAKAGTLEIKGYSSFTADFISINTGEAVTQYFTNEVDGILGSIRAVNGDGLRVQSVAGPLVLDGLYQDVLINLTSTEVIKLGRSVSAVTPKDGIVEVSGYNNGAKGAFQFKDTGFFADLITGRDIEFDRTTLDEAFINFKASADADAVSAISTLTTSGAVTHHIQVEINGVKAWIPCSTNNPT